MDSLEANFPQHFPKTVVTEEATVVLEEAPVIPKFKLHGDRGFARGESPSR
jgi:hypothetical protein